MGFEHQTVLLKEAVDALQVRPEGHYVDGTFGRGGHSREILRRLAPEGRLLVLDRDPEAVDEARGLAREDARLEVEQMPFDRLSEAIDSRGWRRHVDGLLLDLGVSSPQLDDAARGFSFMRDGPLDMRMNPHEGQSAAEYLARADAAELQTVFSELGEERHAGRIARAIVRERADRPITTTRQLAELIGAVVPSREPGKHPATRVFQALRIHINRELDQLVSVLKQALELMAPGGRIVVITFHSLEDRIVKRFFNYHLRGPETPRHLPVPTGMPEPRLAWAARPVRAGEAEVANNPRSRSATLRVAALAGGAP